MPSGLLALHTITGKWTRSPCLGSGVRVEGVPQVTDTFPPPPTTPRARLRVIDADKLPPEAARPKRRTQAPTAPQRPSKKRKKPPTKP